MDGDSFFGTAFQTAALQDSRLPGAAFGELPAPARALDPGMGEAVARRTVFRPGDAEDFGRVADRVAAGNIGLLPHAVPQLAELERQRLRNAIASGALITSGRHLQHGDSEQHTRNMEVFTNCATACASFAKFYLLLNGSGVGRSYDDAMMAVDWARAPELRLRLDTSHKDYPHGDAALRRLATELGLLPWGHSERQFDAASLRAELGQVLVAQDWVPPENCVVEMVGDTREGWGHAVERLESMAFAGAGDAMLLLDLSEIRPAGSPIAGMQGRPASGPLSLLRAFFNIQRHVIERARRDAGLERWEQAMLVDHHLSVEVQVGGARRAARMATKSWRDPGVLGFIRSKSEGGLWTANNSVMVDAEFWQRVNGSEDDALSRHARRVFDEVTRCSYMNGEPGLINGDRLEDHRTGTAWQKPVHEDGRDFRSARYQVESAAGLLADLSRRASETRFPVTTNPCGEIVLHVTGGYCVIGDFAPLLACPVSLDGLLPGLAEPEVAEQWDARVRDSVRLGVRFLIRANQMDALYNEEVARTNRIGIGPTGLHEWAWMRYGLSFDDLLDESVSAPFWAEVAALSRIAKEEAAAYSSELGLNEPVTVTTVKPAGTTSKLFGLTEGVHLPARRQYLRWVQFKGEREGGEQGEGGWRVGADPLLAEYEQRGYPVRGLRSFPGMSIVGFPTVPLIMKLGLGNALRTAPEATPEQQYAWLRLLERHWIGERQGNQVSYTLKIYTDRHDLGSYRALVREQQPQVRCCSILPSKPDHELGYEYLPEEEVDEAAFAGIVSRIDQAAGGSSAEAVDLAQLQCASGACPI